MVDIPTPSLFYDGKPQTSSSTQTFQSIDPSTALPLTTITTSTPTDIDAAIASAARAFPTWSSTPAPSRARILLHAASLLRSRTPFLATLETLDTGKAYSETSAIDVATGADALEYFAHLVASSGLSGEATPLRPDAWVYTAKAPLGVCAALGAWNYPLQIALWKAAAGLAAGNTLVYKPSEVTPLHSSVLAALFAEAGLPPGVFNVVQGGGETGAYLAAHPGIAKVSFTGQVATGRKVAAAAGAGLKYVTMELGGKSALVVLADAEVEQAVDGAMMANFYSSGQVCTNGTRVFVPRRMKEAFEAALLRKMRFIRPGDLMDPATNFGPLVSRVHHEKVVGYIRHGIEVDRATLLHGGLGKLDLPDGVAEELKSGFWVRPTVFTDCTDDMRIVKEEIFGPVMSILTYDTVEEVVRRANDTTLGLAAGVFTKDLNLAHKVIAQLEAGITWINTWGESPAEMSVGGWKMSGVGVENGRRGIEAWVRNKSTLVDMAGEVATVFSKL
ncbi:betaine aldehyde dehydrogenase [Glonium stellatum]|uniref:aldehyde dehydrogenase (NAD(+)) n=1 Tax=Glonium stellatum TaxID=574774 RepID=A0A8E2EZJ6_9PEZI|nr:betaine aldehyde dehydrogenase [Glonium stellatum]